MSTPLPPIPPQKVFLFLGNPFLNNLPKPGSENVVEWIREKVERIPEEYRHTMTLKVVDKRLEVFYVKELKEI